MGIFGAMNGWDSPMEKAQYDAYIQQAKIENAQIAQGMYNQGVISGATQPREQFNPNKHEAYQVPLSQLVTMWRLKYGDEWVDASRPHDGGFYAHACVRLNNNDMFERQHGWVRLKEGAE